VHVTVNPLNDAPSLSSVPTNATIDELANYSFTATANDVDAPAQNLTFSLIGAPTGATINSSTGQFTWAPTEAQGGAGTPYSFTVRVSDGVSNTEANISLSVSEVNQAPTLNPIGNKVFAPGVTLTFTASGADADLPAQTLSFSLIGAPAGATINAGSGAFSWTPSASDIGKTFTFRVRITDNGSPTLYAEEQITVSGGYTWSGFLPPLQPGGVYNAGRTIPVKFKLTGPSAGITNLVARLYIVSLNNSALRKLPKIRMSSAASTENLFRYSGDGYIFNLDTSGIPPDDYQLQVDMGDGVMRAINITLR
jgi:hypothetical protein